MKKLIVTLLLFAFAFNVQAKYTQTCKIKYRKDYGWSDYYQVEVNFLSGHELNQATKSYEYSSYNTYAVIFWGEGQASVIEIEGYTGCGTTVKQSCISNKYTNMEGEDQKGVKWEICTRSSCF